MSSLSLRTLTLKAITFAVSTTGTGKVILSLGAVITSDGPLNSRPICNQFIIPVSSCASVIFLL